MASREDLVERVRHSTDRLVELCRALVQVDSQNPPGDTSALVRFIETWLGERENLEKRRLVAREPAVNLLVRTRGAGSGRRLVFNGHLDTFPVGNRAAWTVEPLGAQLRDGRIYGRGVSDMKAGLAASLIALDLMWQMRSQWQGELVLTLAGDEETGGQWGTKWLLDHVPEAKGDAMICGDAGSPRVARVGEKGYLWIELRAAGRAAHGAHVHLGQNAVERLWQALSRILALAGAPCPVPEEIVTAVRSAAPVSEPISGAGESKTLTSFTANIGTIQGGVSVNLVPDTATARVDLRFPPGSSVGEVERRVRETLAGVPGIDVRVLGSAEPNWTSPSHEIVRLVIANSAVATGTPAVANMRPGFSDSRFYRFAGVPAVVYGPTAHNMGGGDEYVTIEDLQAVCYVHTLTAFDYLSAKR